MFYGGRELGALTSNSVEESVESLVRLVKEVPHSSLSVKIGGGEPKTSLRLARSLRERLPPSASIEIVDESGTSAGKRGAIGATRDQRAAARIAFRKGTQFSDSLALEKKSRVSEEIDSGPNSPLTRSSLNHDGIKSIILWFGESRVHEEDHPDFPGFSDVPPGALERLPQSGKQRQHHVRLVLVEPVDLHLPVLCVHGR